MRIPRALTKLRNLEGGAAWLRRLPALVGEIAEAWTLDVADPFEGSTVSWVAPARRGDDDVVLKIQWPHPECEHEAAALTIWAGDGAVRLLDHDKDRHALLLERCLPGTQLANDESTDPLGVMIEILPRLWKPAGSPFRPLADESNLWSTHMPGRWESAGRPCERRLVDAAISYLDELPTHQGDQVLLHQDLHGENVLAARREPWLAIDPKPLVGEREFGIAPIVRSFEFGHSRDHVKNRLARLCTELGLDEGRARGWTIAQAMAWSFDSAYAALHHDTVRWLLDS